MMSVRSKYYVRFKLKKKKSFPQNPKETRIDPHEEGRSSVARGYTGQYH